MLRLRPVQRDRGELRARVRQLRARAVGVEAGGDAALVAGVGQVVGAQIGGAGLAQQLGLGIQPAQAEIGVGDLRMQAEPRAGEIGGAGGLIGTAGARGIAQPAP